MNNAQKLPFARSLNRFAEAKVADALAIVGKALPCSVVSVSGSIVTVKFEVNCPFTLPNVTVPIGYPEYIRLPVQAGDKGIVQSTDASLGGISGLGNGIASLVIQANLSALFFTPIANNSWSASEDPNSIVLYGPNGGILRNVSKTSVVKVSSDGTQITVPAAKSLRVSTLPVAAGGLPSGSFWQDVGTGNVKVVP